MTHSNTTDVATESLSIREFARYYGHAEAVVRRAMRQISVRGISQGRGRPTLLSSEHQELLLDHIEGPLEAVEGDPEEISEAYESDSFATEDPGPEDYGSQEDSSQEEQADLYEPVRVTPVEPVPQNAPLQHAPKYADPYTGHYNMSSNPRPARDYDLSISPGNHRMTLETPEIPRSYDLGQFRSEEAVPAIADPGEIASQAMAAIDSLVAGMDADIRQQRNQLNQTQKAAKALRIKAKRLHEKKIEYMIQSSAISQAQRQSTADLQEALGEVQSLGKSPRSEQEPPSS